MKNTLSVDCSVYYAKTDDLSSTKTYEKALESLPKIIRRHIESYKTEEDRILSCYAYSLLIKELSDLKKDVNNAEFLFTESGKPYIKGNDCFFSLSHSENLVAVAISKNEVGVDIEKIIEKDLKIADRFFHPSETESIKNSENKVEEFIKIWTRKEALVKAKGCGLNAYFKNFSALEDKAEGFNIASEKVFDTAVLSVAFSGISLKITPVSSLN